MLAACQSEDAQSKPTHTRIPGGATAIYLTVVGVQAELGTPTYTPGYDSLQMAVDLTLTPRVTQSPHPTHTPRAPYPGYATQVFEGVNLTLEAQNRNTNTPNPHDAVGTSIALTLEHTWWGTNTPEPTPTPSQ